MDKNNKDIELRKGQDSPMNINSKKLLNEMIHLKDDILKDIKSFERNYSEKFREANSLIDERLEEFERRIETYNQRLYKISEYIIEDKSLKEKIGEISSEKNEIKEQILKTILKFDKLEKEYTEKIGEIDRILNDSVIYQGIIGNKGRFINFHEFIDYILSQVGKFSIISQTNTSDISAFKSRLESNIKNIKGQIEEVKQISNYFTRKTIAESENRLKDILKSNQLNYKEIREENEKNITKYEQLNKEIKDELKNEIENEKIKNKEDKDKLDQSLSDLEKQMNDLKEQYNKLNDELNIIKEIIGLNEEGEKKENKKDLVNIHNKNNNNDIYNNYEIDENELNNKFFRGEINENQFLIHKEFMRLNNMIKNVMYDIIEKNSNDNKKRHLRNKRNSSGNNLFTHLSSCFDNIISEISPEKTKRKTVNNLLHCINLKLTAQDKDGKRRNDDLLNLKKSSSTIVFKTFDLNNDIQLKINDNNKYMINDIGYKTFQINNGNKNLNSVNSKYIKKNFDEDAKNNDRNIINEEKEMHKKKNDYTDFNEFKYLKVKNEKNINLINSNKYKNEELKIKECNNKSSNLIKDKLFIKRTNSIKKDLINKITKNTIDNENVSERKVIKDNILEKIKNNIIKDEESKQSKVLNNTLTQRKDIENKIETNTINISSYKPFKGKKYIGYEKSFDAKVKGKLISYDIDYKDRMKKNYYSDLCFAPNGSLVLPKSKKRKEAENIENMVNNLQSYISDNSYQNKRFFQRNNIFNLNQSMTKLRENLFNSNE